MGQSHSSEGGRNEVSTEQLSHELTLHFASKCFTHLEITHYKDNFKSLADHQGDVEYWKEETLCRFLCLPDALRAGPVLYQMSTYLGAFPFPILSPCILTREAMLKIITIMTDRYRKILKRGEQDKVKLLFRSLAVFDRRASFLASEEKEKSHADGLLTTENLKTPGKEPLGLDEAHSHVSGFAIDEPANDDEEEDDDDLVIAALDSLDAIEVFKHDQKTDRKIHHAQIPVENFKKLIMLLLSMMSLGPQESLAVYGKTLTDGHLARLQQSADCIIQSFDPDKFEGGVRYQSFVQTTTICLPYLFGPLNPLFERFLFSKNMNLSKRREGEAQPSAPEPSGKAPLIMSSAEEENVLNQATLAQISTFLNFSSEEASSGQPEFRPLYSTITHGTSLSSFSRQVLSWRSPTLLLVRGTMSSSNQTVTIGAYLSDYWRDSSSTATSGSSSTKPVMFELAPRHSVFPGNPYNKSTPTSYFSSNTGIALGCVIPTASRTHAASVMPALGPVGLLIDSDISTATFQHDGDGGSGAFVTDPGLEAAQRRGNDTAQPKKFDIDIDVLEVWGINVPIDSGEDEATKQKKRLAWEEAEAARRRGVNFGGDKDGARALLEMAGIVGDKAGNRSGGSV